MTVTILDAQNAGHSGAMDIREWAEEFMQEWTRPLVEMAEARANEKVLMFVDSLPPEAMEMMKKKDPAAYAKAKKKIAEIRKQRKNG